MLFDVETKIEVPFDKAKQAFIDRALCNMTVFLPNRRIKANTIQSPVHLSDGTRVTIEDNVNHRWKVQSNFSQIACKSGFIIPSMPVDSGLFNQTRR